MSNTQKVYVLKSNLSLSEIRKDFENVGASIPSFLRIIYKNLDGKLVDSRKNLCICSEDDINLLVFNNKDYKGKGTVQEYDWTRFAFPSSTQSWDLHVTGLPNSWTKDKSISFIQDRVSNVCPLEDLSIFLSFDRETGLTNGFGSIVFKDTVSEDYRKYCKLALHMTPIKDDDHDTYVSVSWRMLPKQRTTFVKRRVVGEETVSAISGNAAQTNVDRKSYSSSKSKSAVSTSEEIKKSGKKTVKVSNGADLLQKKVATVSTN